MRTLLGAALATNVIAQDASLATRHSSGTQLCSHDIGCSRQSSVMIDTRADVELDVFGLLSLGGSVGVDIGLATGVKIECVDCRTWGTAVITNTVATIENNLLGGLVNILTNPAELVREYAQLEALISLEEVGGHIELDIFAAEAATYTFNVFEAGLISDIEILSIIDLGINVFLDLVISVEAGLDLSAGFEFSFPEGASFVVDLLSGVISNHDFTGAVMNDLPIVVLAGEAELKAALRMRVEVGTKLTLPISTVEFEFAAFADLLEYSTVIATTDSCPLHISGGVDVSLGAIAQLAVDLDFASFSLAPSAVVNILNVDLPTICTTRPATITPLARLGSGTSVVSGASTSVTSIVISDLPSASASVPGVSAALPTGSLPDASGSIIGITSPSDVSVSGAPIPSAGSVTGPFVNSTLPSGTGADSGLESNPTITSAASLTTSTVYATQVSTITSCAANVLHCPASMTGTTVVTQTVVQYTTVCPVAEAESSAALASAAGSTPLPAFTTTSSSVQVAPSSITPKVTLTPVAVTSTSTIQVASSAEGVAITPSAPASGSMASVTGSSPSVGSSASASSLAQGSGSAPASSAVTDSGVVGSSPSSVVASSPLASSSAASVLVSGNSGSSGSVVSSAVSSPLASSPAAGNSGSSGSVVSSAVSSPIASSPASGSGNSGSSGNSSPVASSLSPEETSESSGLTLSSASPSVGASGSKSTVTSFSTGTLFQTSTVITHGYTTVTVVPVQSTGSAQPVSPAEGAGSSAGSVAPSPASGSSSVAVGVSGSPASPSVILSGSSQSEAGEVCAPTVTVTAAAYTITQTPSIITVYRTASASGVSAPADVASSAVDVPGSPMSSVAGSAPISSSKSALGLVISPSSAAIAGESSAPGASAPVASAPVASAQMAGSTGSANGMPAVGASSAIGMYPSAATGIIAATGSPSSPAGVAPGSPAPTGALYPIGANNGTAAAPSGSGIPVKPSTITGPVRSFTSEPTNAATTGAVPPLMIATGSAGRLGVSMSLVAGVMGLVALL
ncbi:hypothetical protein CJF31_00012084 [Rutstroemia sp. NJR-2017a BVV2]|nr:extracellular serine-threonine rich protein [Rutstroemia sp. NJR-2017a BVV2]PQE19682.1 hypothetical protein CJF31_00012084 [Rutstroemia sp. NJR-2017a BVV2]